MNISMQEKPKHTERKPEKSPVDLGFGYFDLVKGAGFVHTHHGLCDLCASAANQLGDLIFLVGTP